MPTFTPRLGLTLPATPEEYDINIFNGNASLLDADLGGLVMCTSLTRPSTGNYTGRLAFETDTGLMIIRDAANTGWLIGTTVVTCTSVTRPTSTHAGMLIYETDTQCLVIRNSANTGWNVRMGGQTYYNTANDSTTTSSSTFGLGTGGSMPSSVFIAPATGEVVLHYSAALTTTITNGNGTVYYAPSVKTGSAIGLGTVVVAPSENDALQVAGTLTTQRGSAHRVVPSLVAGGVYNVQMNVKIFSTSGGPVGTIAAKKLIIQPT